MQTTIKMIIPFSNLVFMYLLAGFYTNTNAQYTLKILFLFALIFTIYYVLVVALISKQKNLHYDQLMFIEKIENYNYKNYSILLLIYQTTNLMIFLDNPIIGFIMNISYFLFIHITDSYYIHFVLHLLGYKIYKITDENGYTYFCITKKDLNKIKNKLVSINILKEDLVFVH
ncbi:MAG: hypothetical protein QXF12_00515 [Candidatus Aenigmatarchaeota archaeon]